MLSVIMLSVVMLNVEAPLKISVVSIEVLWCGMTTSNE
jgi:hypothetical protein